MWDLSVINDRVLSYVSIRRHLLFFYFYPQGVPDEPLEVMLRRHGNDAMYELEQFVNGCHLEGINFTAVIHQYFLQGPTVYTPFTYEAPALPHIVCFAGVCRSWYQSIVRVVGGRIFTNVYQLWRLSQLRHDAVEWLHRSDEDRFRLGSWLIVDINLCRVIAPLDS